MAVFLGVIIVPAGSGRLSDSEAFLLCLWLISIVFIAPLAGIGIRTLARPYKTTEYYSKRMWIMDTGLYAAVGWTVGSILIGLLATTAVLGVRLL